MLENGKKLTIIFEGNEKSIPIKSSLKEIEQDFKKEFNQTSNKFTYDFYYKINNNDIILNEDTFLEFIEYNIGKLFAERRTEEIFENKIINNQKINLEFDSLIKELENEMIKVNKNKENKKSVNIIIKSKEIDLCYKIVKDNSINMKEKKLIEELKEEKNKLEEENKIFQISNENHIKLKEDYNKLLNRNNILEDENNKFKEENNKFKEENNKLKSENKKYQEENNILKADNNKINDDYDKIKGDNNKLKDDYDLFKEENNKLKEENNGLKEDNNRYKENNIKLSEDNKKFEEENNKYKEENNKLKEEGNELKNIVKNFEENIKQNISSNSELELIKIEQKDKEKKMNEEIEKLIKINHELEEKIKIKNKEINEYKAREETIKKKNFDLENERDTLNFLMKEKENEFENYKKEILQSRNDLKKEIKILDQKLNEKSKFNLLKVHKFNMIIIQKYQSSSNNSSNLDTTHDKSNSLNASNVKKEKKRKILIRLNNWYKNIIANKNIDKIHISQNSDGNTDNNYNYLNNSQKLRIIKEEEEQNKKEYMISFNKRNKLRKKYEFNEEIVPHENLIQSMTFNSSNLYES